MKTTTKLISLFLLSTMFCACSKDNCPDEITVTRKYYNISEKMKQKFPYHFKDTQVWINVSTTDTLHYILKDTVSSSYVKFNSPTEGCRENNYEYDGRFTFKFNCIEDTIFNYQYIYQSDDGYGFLPYLKFNKTEYYTYIDTYDTIINYSKIYKEVRDREYFWENHENGIVRITLSNVKLYRIK